ncbi:hypothetical protein SAMN04488044_3270 [Cognatishimia maritima]|uniref:Uncharacterized protein n=1 Tax=Cognatishimia maritima TaxID=870908 RepID=A0A1M5VUM7_9RHOB|nr:hypothetical protein SAMN04488044_3270 [Cognatishimia maritima]
MGTCIRDERHPFTGLKVPGYGINGTQMQDKGHRFPVGSKDRKIWWFSAALAPYFWLSDLPMGRF